MLWALHHFPASSLAISQAYLHLHFPLLLFVMLCFSTKSLHMWFPLPGILFSVLTDAIGYLLKIHCFHFSYRILEILCLRESGPKTGLEWKYYPISTNYLYEEVTMKHLEGFSLPDNRKVCKQKLSTLISPSFLSQKFIVRPWPAVDQWEKGKRYWLEPRLPGTSAPMLETLTTRHFLM